MHLVQLLGGMELLPLHSVPGACLPNVNAGLRLTRSSYVKHTASRSQLLEHACYTTNSAQRTLPPGLQRMSATALLHIACMMYHS